MGFLSLLKKIPWQLWLLTGVIISFWLYGKWQFELGQADIQGKWNTENARTEGVLDNLSKQTTRVTTAVETKYVDRIKVVHEKAKIITKEIPVYIPADTIELPAGFRLLHDAAARSELPDRTRLSATKPVRVEDAAKIVTENYAQCLHWREQLLGWQEWYQEQTLVWQTDPQK